MPRTSTIEPAAPRTIDQAAAGFAPLTQEQIEEQTDAGSFSRGRSYYRSGHIFDTVRRGNTIRAQCHGSSGGPYIVEATLATTDEEAEENPIDFACDCPRGGFCKHVVALLLTWVYAPESFEVRPPVAELLAGKSREELLALIELMVRQEPDLESRLELPMPVAGAPGAAPVDEAAIRRQIAVALRDDEGYDRRGRYDYDDYYAASRIAGKLARLVELGNSYAAAGQWRNAFAVFATLVEEVAPKYETLRDDEGDLGAIVIECDRALAACLDAQGGLPEGERLAAEERARLIKALFDVWRTDVDSGGHDLAQEGPEAIGRSATAEEQTRVGGWLRALIKPAVGENYHQGWVNRGAIGFLSLLGGDAGLSDEELLEEYRNAELWEEAAETLVRVGRVEEGIALAARRLTAPVILTGFADRLIATGDPGRIEQAIALVDSRLWEQEGQNPHHDTVYLEWLERQYAAHGQPAKALEIARRRFKTAPSKRTYDAVKAAALLPGQPGEPWPNLRPELIAALRKRGDWYSLIDIHLEDGEVAEALAALKKTERGGTSGYTGWGYGWGAPSEGVDARVARAAERDFPGEAIRIYRRLADRMIEARQRSHYKEAAKYLARVKHLLETADRPAEWRTLIDDLRQRNKSLRALREELDALGLS